MRKFGTRTIVRAACLLVVLAVIAIPLSHLMVAQSPERAAATDQATVTAAVAVNTATAEQLSSEAETASAVSSLMAGSAVGIELPRTQVIDLPHPASVFVP